MKKPNVVVGCVGLVSLLSLSCGGDGGGAGGSCGKVAGCGGSVVGDWQIVEFCGSEMSTPPDFCPTGTVDSTGLRYTGNFNAKADMTYSTTLTISGSLKMTLPGPCLMPPGGMKVTCADLEASIKSDAMTDPDSTIQSVTCAVAGDGCTCTLTAKPVAIPETGTYSIAGNVLTMIDDNSADMLEYCVKGSNLHMRDTMSMPMGMTVNMGIVFKK